MTETPKPSSDRIEALDVIRGIALCGLIPVNILDFAFVEDHFFSPRHVDPSQHWLWYLVSIFAIGKFVSLFSLLFGAGILLATEKADSRDLPVTARYLRRLGLLLGMGLLHAYLIWHGDILVPYAIIGFVLFWTRRWPARVHALIGAILLMVLPAGLVLLGLVFRWAGFDIGEWIENAQDDPGTDWMIDSYRNGWFQQIPARFVVAVMVQIIGFPIFFPLCGGMMLLGMAAYKTGFLQRTWTRPRYGIIAMVTLLIGVTLGTASHLISFNRDWNVNSLLTTAPLGSLATILLATGYASAVLFWSFRHQHRFLWHPLRALGRMALTNYLSQSLILGFIFYGHGLNRYTELEFATVMAIVPAVWVFQAVFSVLWLRHFAFGPAEWAWRCLTYGKRFPLRRPAARPDSGRSRP
ncbi:MAG: DUF418 domain-containing protein [Verrucomicrobiota bacterium]